MKYKFKKKNFGSDQDPNTIYDYGVDLDSTTKDNESALSGLDWWGWTEEEIQSIIDGSIGLESDNDEYNYQVEGSDFSIHIKKTGVLMWARGSSTPDVSWNFKEFIDFMAAFQEFVKNNS